MGCSFDVAFRNVPDSGSIRRHLRKEIERLDRKFEGIQTFRVTFGLPYHHRYPGNIYDLQIEVDVPGHRLKVEKGPSADGSSADVYSLIHEAFCQIERDLEGCVCARQSEANNEIKKQPHLYRRSANLDAQA